MIEDYSETKKKLSFLLQRDSIRSERTVYHVALNYIVNGTNLSTVLRNLCEEIDNSTYSMSCIMLYDREERTLSSYSSYSLPPHILNVLTNVKVASNSCSSGVAAYRKK